MSDKEILPLQEYVKRLLEVCDGQHITDRSYFLSVFLEANPEQRKDAIQFLWVNKADQNFNTILNRIATMRIMYDGLELDNA